MLFSVTFLLAGMWSFLSHNLFLAFSLYALPGAVLFLILGSYVTMYLAPGIWKSSGRATMLVLGVLLFIGGLVVAHIKTAPSEREPLLTNLKYVYDEGTDKSYLSTFDDDLHQGHKELLDGEAINKRLPRHLPYSKYYKPTTFDYSKFISEVNRDTTDTTSSNLYTCQIINPQKANVAFVEIPDLSNVDSLIIDQKIKSPITVRKRRGYEVTLYGIGLDTLDVRIVPKDDSKTEPIHVSMEYGVFPEPLSLPEGYAWNDPVTYISHKIMLGQ